MDTFSCLRGNNSRPISVFAHQVSSNWDISASNLQRRWVYNNFWTVIATPIRATQSIPGWALILCKGLVTSLFRPSQFRFRSVDIDRGKRRSNSNIWRIWENRCTSRHNNAGRENSKNREALQNSSRSWSFGHTADLLKSSRILWTFATARQTCRLPLQPKAN